MANDGAKESLGDVYRRRLTLFSLVLPSDPILKRRRLMTWSKLRLTIISGME